MMYDSYKINTKILKRAITEINNSLDPVKEKSKYQICKASNIDCQKKFTTSRQRENHSQFIYSVFGKQKNCNDLPVKYVNKELRHVKIGTYLRF